MQEESRKSCPQKAVSRGGRGGARSGPTSVHPLGQIVAGLQLRGDLRGVHLRVLGEVLGILPLEVLDALLGVRLAPEVAVRRRLLVFGLTERQGHRDRAGAAVEGNLDY